MRTVQQLTEAGFKVNLALDAIECTEVVSAKPFWYYNMGFYETMSDIHEHLALAAPHAEGYRLLVAGIYESHQVFPFNVIDGERKQLLDDARSRFVASRNDMTRAEADYLDAVRTDEAYAD